MQQSADRASYYARASTWAQDTHGRLQASRNLAWLVAVVAAGVAALEAVALVLLVPLKTVEPYAFVVDRQTGRLELAQPLANGPLREDVAVTQSYLAQYVLARETFDAADLQTNYQRVAAWSGPQARREYLATMRGDNPESPLKLYPSSTLVRTTVKSVTLLDRDSALVRFDTERQDAGGSRAERRAWVAAVGFRYTGKAARLRDRLDNPLGFEVVSYRRDSEELLSPPSSRPQADATP